MNHDQKKVKEELSEVQKNERKELIEKFTTLQQSAYSLREEWNKPVEGRKYKINKQDGGAETQKSLQETIEALTPLLEKNPDNYSIFAFRRELFEALKVVMFPDFVKMAMAEKAKEDAEKKEQQQEQQQGSEAATVVVEKSDEEKLKEKQLQQQKLQENYSLYFSKEILIPELKINTEIVKRDYKSYAAWVHRRWVLNLMHTKVKLAVLKEENAKIEQLLSRDERNFHAWGYRRWVTSELKAAGLYSDDLELTFATSKIGNNFSNYSAWHNRALVLFERIDQIVSSKNGDDSNSSTLILEKVLTQIKEDQEMLIQAFYCDPFDQSAFVYCKNLIEKVHQAALATPQIKSLQEANLNLQHAVRDACSELKQEEGKAVWPRYMLLLCLPKFVDEEALKNPKSWEELKELDPMRKQYYDYEMLKRKN
jgi:hypothetical protein